MTNIAPLFTCTIRDTWRTESYGWHGFPARLGKAVPADTPGNNSAVREASRKRLKRAVWQRTRDSKAEPQRLFGCPAQPLDPGVVTCTAGCGSNGRAAGPM